MIHRLSRVWMILLGIEELECRAKAKGKTKYCKIETSLL
jgi:hypothetical protein